MSDLAEYFDVLIVIVVVVLQLMRWAKRLKGRRERPEPVPPAKIEIASLPPDDGPEPIVGDPLEGIDDLAVQLTDLRQSAVELEIVLGSVGGTGEVLVKVLHSSVFDELDRALLDLEAARRQAESLPPAESVAYIQRSPIVQTARETARVAEFRLEMISVLASSRADRATAQMLGDADAIAAALLRPLALFARAHDVSIPDQRPICVPGSGYESVFINLLPPDHPVIVVPDDFGEDLLRWSSIAHEIGHVMWFKAPGFADEIRAMTGVSGRPTLLSIGGGHLQGNIKSAFVAWLPEMIADAFAALLLGPAALRGMMHIYDELDSPAALVSVHTDDDITYGTHPPGALRVRWTASLLVRMGFDVEAKALLQSWETQHGEISHLVVPIRGGRLVELPIDLLVDPGREILEKWYTATYRTLAGFALPAIPGLEMSPGVWARVGARRRDLCAGARFNDDPRVVIAAAVEAGADASVSPTRVAEGVRRAIIGLGTGERRVTDESADQRGYDLGQAARLGEFRDALILAEVLHHRVSQGRGPRSRLKRV